MGTRPRPATGCVQSLEVAGSASEGWEGAGISPDLAGRRGASDPRRMPRSGCDVSLDIRAPARAAMVDDEEDDGKEDDEKREPNEEVVVAELAKEDVDMVDAKLVVGLAEAPACMLVSCE